jgi:hypothetical protein
VSRRVHEYVISGHRDRASSSKFNAPLGVWGLGKKRRERIKAAGCTASCSFDAMHAMQNARCLLLLVGAAAVGATPLQQPLDLYRCLAQKVNLTDFIFVFLM